MLPMETIFDLPAHPLMVHFPVVAIPVLAILALVMVVRPSFRNHYGLAIVGLGVITTVATFMAAWSGQALAESIGIGDDLIDPHRTLGNTLRFFVLGLTIAVGVSTALSKRSSTADRDPMTMAAMVLVVGFSLLSLIWTVRTGHEGAKSVWQGVVGTESAESAEDEQTTVVVEPDTTVSTTEAPSDPPEATTAEPTTTEVADDVAAVSVIGQDVYEANCSRCHGADGAGGRGPSFEGLALEQPDNSAAIEQTVNGGGGMPAFGARLSEEEILAAVDYIYATF